MKAERDMAGVALPFAAGITATMYISALHAIPSSLPLAAAIGCIFVLTHPSTNSFSSGTIRISALLAPLCCGIFVGLSDMILSPAPWRYHWGAITDITENFRECIVQKIADIPFRESQTGATLTALITGDRHLLAPDTAEAFRKSGASHILALSGLHLGIIYGIIRQVLSPLGNNRIPATLRSVILISACGFYAIATGASPSITRAFLFILIGESATITGRFRDIGTTLMTALLFQLLLDPSSIKSVSFQLSYATMAGIAFIYPQLKGIWPDENGGLMKRIWNSSALSISCQLTTGPLAYVYFGSFPQYFILTNLIALPLVGLIIPAGLLTLSLETLGICPVPVIRITECLTKLMLDTLGVISAM